VLVGIFIGNEVFRQYHERLVFTTVLFFFALMSYAIFMVPVFTHTIGTWTFLLSGIAGGIVFMLFLRLLNFASAARLGEVRWQIGLGALGVFAAINFAYFLNVLPPLPLALQQGGVFHSVKKIGPVYYAMSEPSSWTEWVGVPPAIHMPDGGRVYVYSAVFAPISLTTRIVHLWQRYDPAKSEWVTVQRIPFTIIGGRRNGYRGYTFRTDPDAGLWRVDIESDDGRLIGRITFSVSGEPQGAADRMTVLD